MFSSWNLFECQGNYIHPYSSEYLIFLQKNDVNEDKSMVHRNKGAHLIWMEVI